MPRGPIQPANRLAPGQVAAPGGQPDRCRPHHEQRCSRQGEHRQGEFAQNRKVEIGGEDDEEARDQEDDERLLETAQLRDAGDVQVRERNAENGSADQPGLVHQEVRDRVSYKRQRQKQWCLQRLGDEVAPERPGHEKGRAGPEHGSGRRPFREVERQVGHGLLAQAVRQTDQDLDDDGGEDGPYGIVDDGLPLQERGRAAFQPSVAQQGQDDCGAGHDQDGSNHG